MCTILKFDYIRRFVREVEDLTSDINSPVYFYGGRNGEETIRRFNNYFEFIDNLNLTFDEKMVVVSWLKESKNGVVFKDGIFLDGTVVSGKLMNILENNFNKMVDVKDYNFTSYKVKKSVVDLESFLKENHFSSGSIEQALKLILENRSVDYEHRFSRIILSPA